MNDFAHRLDALLDEAPQAGDRIDVERAVAVGRRIRRRRRLAGGTVAVLAGAGTAAGGVAVAGHDAGHAPGATLRVASSPGPSPASRASSGARHSCRSAAAPSGAAPTGLPDLSALSRLVHPRNRRLGPRPIGTEHGQSWRLVDRGGRRGVLICLSTPQPAHGSGGPSTPAATYSPGGSPQAIASRLGDHLSSRLTHLGLTVAYTRPFGQESDAVPTGAPTYYDGNDDVREPGGYADVGVEVTHSAATQQPLTGRCATAHHDCVQTSVPGGGELRTARLRAGTSGGRILTAEVARPDGVVVQAQESNYAFGPDAGDEPHGHEPLTVPQLVTLAEDPAFTF